MRQTRKMYLPKHPVYIKFSDDKIRTADLRYRKRLVYQLNHNHCPTIKTVHDSACLIVWAKLIPIVPIYLSFNCVFQLLTSVCCGGAITWTGATGLAAYITPELPSIKWLSLLKTYLPKLPFCTYKVLCKYKKAYQICFADKYEAQVQEVSRFIHSLNTL